MGGVGGVTKVTNSLTRAKDSKLLLAHCLVKLHAIYGWDVPLTVEGI